VRWPSQVAPGTTVDEPVCLTDLYATSLAAGGAAPRGGEDAVDLVPLLTRGDATELAARPGIVHHSLDGMFAIRVGKWKLVEGLGTGGFTAPKRRAPTDGEPPVQLYDLDADPRETTNLAADHPDVVARLQTILDEVRDGDD
jgi:arylsulfatase A